ncbi:hypothetical protein NQ317_000436 [Molorchus minor]|uniref:PiggyBac transposable element-derived protein domain-containing protein n=1 Tax=Molorchus minor TaxID=1323400 RepID=A0ABQ9IUU8_9CUCU|nr:hypothetical protein NQ317_000436 [Molorchus minor]
MTDTMLEKIVFYTNEYIRSKSYDTKDLRTHNITDLIELKAFIGLLYISGANKSGRQNIEDLFRSNGMAMEIFRLTMCQRRFQFLLTHIRFDQKITRAERQSFDKFAAFREIFDEFVSNLPKHYNPSAYLTIDEILASFRGRCGFKVYIPSKPNRYGIKIYALVDAKLFYVIKLEVYLGKQPQGPFAVDNTNLALVCRLCEPVRGSNRNITMDNFFTSKAVADTLLRDYHLTIIGTMRKNKPQIPSELIMIRRPEKSSMFTFDETSTLVSYVPRKNKCVIVLSTMHHDDKLDATTGKPEMIIDYNHTKGGVDVVDQMSEAYNCARATRRWPLVVFYELLNVAGINTCIVFKSNNQTSIRRRKFLELLGYELIQDHISRRSTNKRLPRTIRLRLQEMCGKETENVPANQNPIYGRCLLCSSKKNRKTRYKCLKCSRFLCLEHLNGICHDCYIGEDTDE